MDFSALVIGGTYDGGIVGLDVGCRSDRGEASEAEGPVTVGDSPTFSPAFGFKAHMSSVKDMDSKKQFLVTASGDETIRIYNLKTRCDNGILSKHTGSVTSVTISRNGKYMISCGEDKLVCIWRCSDWEPLLCLEGCHEYTPISADFHPSMRLALSLDTKGSICLINLLEGEVTNKYDLSRTNEKGNKAMTTKYDVFSGVKFNYCGNYYAVISQKNVVILSILDEKLSFSLSSVIADLKSLGPKQISCFTWITDEHFIVGFSDGDMRLFTIYNSCLTSLGIEFAIDKGEYLSDSSANPHHNNRIKGIEIVECDVVSGNGKPQENVIGKLVSCDSSGVFVLSKFCIEISYNEGVREAKCSFDILDIHITDNRITCMTVHTKLPLTTVGSLSSPKKATSQGKTLKNKGKKTKNKQIKKGDNE